MTHPPLDATDGDGGDGGNRPLTVPAGVSVMIPIWWIHRSPVNYPDSPETFDPDRFFVPERAAKIHRYANHNETLTTTSTTTTGSAGDINIT